MTETQEIDLNEEYLEVDISSAFKKERLLRLVMPEIYINRRFFASYFKEIGNANVIDYLPIFLGAGWVWKHYDGYYIITDICPNEFFYEKAHYIKCKIV